MNLLYLGVRVVHERVVDASMRCTLTFVTSIFEN